MSKPARTLVAFAALAVTLSVPTVARSKAPPGATAQCRDGTYSFSAHHSGTCSHHGGVAAWLHAGGSPPAPTTTRTCRAPGALPDAGCTPGAVFASATRGRICVPGYSGAVRNVPESEKRAVYREYGIATHQVGQYEVDHLVSLELGGSNAISNLWPERASPRPGFHEKDRVENYLHARVCSGAMTLADAQHVIAGNWLSVYRLLP